MKTLVIYESMYGNTHRIAEAIGHGLKASTATPAEVTVGPVGAITPESAADADLIVVGGPTHVHGMSGAKSRAAAMEAAEKDESIDADPDASGPGIREWLKELPTSPSGRCAAFDTRIHKSAVLTGSAAKGIAKRLKGRKYRAVSDPESFFVEDSEGPLEPGEEDRARQWGIQLAEMMVGS